MEILKDYFGESFKPAIDGNDFAGRDEIIGNITTTRSFKDMMGKPTEGYWLRNKDWFFQQTDTTITTQNIQKRDCKYIEEEGPRQGHLSFDMYRGPIQMRTMRRPLVSRNLKSHSS